MPVILQTLENPSYQGQQDLQKIYRDAPAWLFAPFSGRAHLIESAWLVVHLLPDVSMTAYSARDACRATAAPCICPICACEKLPDAVASLNDG